MQKLQTKGFFSEPGVAAIDEDEAICRKKNEHEINFLRPYILGYMMLKWS